MGQPRDGRGTVFAPVRTLITLALVAGFVWGSFNVKLGRRTLAQHLDRIGDTPEAKELLEGTRSTVNPLLHEATDRVLGERVEAPTALEAPAGGWSKVPPTPVDGQPSDGALPVRTSTARQTKLPGRR